MFLIAGITMASRMPHKKMKMVGRRILAYCMAVLPHPSPLDSGLRRNDEVGGGSPPVPRILPRVRVQELQHMTKHSRPDGKCLWRRQRRA